MKKPAKVFKIAVCGSNASGLPGSFNEKAKVIGQTIAKLGHQLFTGVTTGFSYEAVQGASQAGGVVIGISPATTYEEHVERFEKVELDLWSTIIYTGVGYKMRDVIMIRSIDAAIYIGGGVGTLVEMSSAPDLKKVMGILAGSGGATDLIETIQKISHRNPPIVIKEEDPIKLVEKIIQKLTEMKG